MSVFLSDKLSHSDPKETTVLKFQKLETLKSKYRIFTNPETVFLDGS